MAYGLRNNATSKLTEGIGTASTSVSITVGEGQLFINNSVATLESRNSDGDVVKREVVLISGISGDTLTIERAYGPCVVDDTAEDKEMQAVAQSFSAGDTLSIYLASEVIQDLYTPAQEVSDLCNCVCNNINTRKNCIKNCCLGDIGYGTGCDGDCVLTSGCHFLDATKEYQFRNLTICSGACVRFINSGLPKIHVCGEFRNCGCIDLRGGCPVGNHSFTNCFGTVSNNYCATCYNAQCYGCGGKGGQSAYTTLTNGPKGGDGGNANISGGTGIGGKGAAQACVCIQYTYGCPGCPGGLGCGGGGGGPSSVHVNRAYISRSKCNCGCDGCSSCGGDGMNMCQWSTYDSAIDSGNAGGGGGGGYCFGKGGNGGFGTNLFSTCCGNLVGGASGGDGGNGGIRGSGGNGGYGCIRHTQNFYSNGKCGCYMYGGKGGKGGNGRIGGNGGNGSFYCWLLAGYTGRTCGGDGGNGVLCGGNGGCVRFCSCTGNISYACAGKGGDAINNMYGLVIRAKKIYLYGKICGSGGNGGNGGSVYCNGALLTSGTNIKGGNGGKGANGAKIMINYCRNLKSNFGTICCSGGTGGIGGTGATCGTAGTNGTTGCFICFKRTM